MDNTRALEEMIKEMRDRSTKAEYSTDREEAHNRKMEKLYNAYVDESAEITRKYKTRSYFLVGAIISVYIGFFVLKAIT